jgi:hypothetical protein
MAYDANRRRAVEDAVEADPVAACVRRMMAKQKSWIGTASDLLDAASIGRDYIAGGDCRLAKKPHARSPVDNTGRRDFSGLSASRSHSSAKAEKEAELSR